MKTQIPYTRKTTMIALLSVISVLLMFFEFSIPIIPSFLKFDFSDIPALIASFSMGPISGIMVIFIKNLLKALFSSTLGIGELCNFIVGSVFVFVAGCIYKRKKTRKVALISMLIGTLLTSFVAVLVNYFIIMPMYSLIMPIDVIINMCKSINPHIHSLFDVIIIFILPFNIIKGLIICFVTFILYKRISYIIKGDNI